MKKKKLAILIGVIALAAVLGSVLFPRLLVAAGKFLVIDEAPVKSDFAVVLNTGVEIYPRLMAAAELYRQGWADRIAVNGNRKTEALRRLEKMGHQPCCPWYEDHLRVLELLGVPRDRVVVIAAEDAYDSVSEAEVVGRRLVEGGAEKILLVTSKYHSRRAGYIWRKQYGERMQIRMVAAGNDPFATEGWWKSGRQIRWVLAEYGAWGYYLWKRFFSPAEATPRR